MERLLAGSVHSIWCLTPAQPIPLGTSAEDCARALRSGSTFTSANRSFLKRIGASEALGKVPDQLTTFWLLDGHGPLEQSCAAARVSASSGEAAVGSEETIVEEEDSEGRIRHVACSLQLDVQDGAICAIWGTERDVTQDIEEGRLLRDTQAFYRAISETALDGICVLDGDQAVLDCNDAFAELVQLPREQVTSEGGVELWPVTGIRDDRMPFSSIARLGRWRGEAILAGTPGLSATEGEALRVDLACRATGAGPTQRFICFVRDLSESRSAKKREQEHQRALAHVARLSTLGEMTSGIAHELNQPLAAIVNYANGCARILSAQGLEDPMVNKGLHAIAEQGRRAADIIARMRKFSRRDEDKREPFLIQDVLSEAIELSMTELHKAGIVVETHFAPIREIVIVDGIQIEQVALNLIRNAVEALSQARAEANIDAAEPSPDPPSVKGPPSITVSTQRSENHRAQKIGGAPGSVTVSIEDNGPGVPPELVDRLFDPFFPGAGDQIGLGLTISRSIIESHGGRLWYAPGEVGASFRFTLPLRTVPIQE